MTDYFRIPNFPQDLIDDLVTSTDMITPVEIEQVYSPHKVGLNLLYEDNNLYDRIGDYFGCPVRLIIYMVSKPNMGMSKLHTDKTRHAAFNIPIQIDHPNSDVILGKMDNIRAYDVKDVYFKGMKYSYTCNYHEDHYEAIKLTEPTIINTALPHAWTNNSNDTRIIASVTFHNNPTYKELIKSYHDTQS